MPLHANYLHIPYNKIMTTLPNYTNLETCKPNKSIIIKLGTYFEWLQYLLCISKIEISVLSSDAQALFQLFFLDKQLNTIAKSPNKNAKMGEL